MQTTNGFRATLSLITIGLLACAGQAIADTDTDRYAESFESYAVGTTVTNFNQYSNSVWTASETNSMIVSTNYTANYQGGDYPIDYDHTVDTKVLQVVNGVTNMIKAGDSGQTNWLDLVVHPVFYDGTPEVPAVGTVAAVYFNTNGNPVVMHTPSNNTTYVEWVTITNRTIGEGDWIRLTIAADFQTQHLPPALNLTRMYRVFINGQALSNEVAYVTGNRNSGLNGSWFGNSRGSFETAPFTNITVTGNGYIDDLVVTNSLVVTAPTTWNIEATAGANGSIAPSGTVSVVEGQSKTFTITPDYGYVVGNVEIVEDGITNNISANSYTFISVQTNGSIHAIFEANLGGTNPPASWMTATGVDPDDLNTDLRGDDMTPRQAWLASTDPTNTAFSFRVTDVRNENGSNFIEWISVFVDTNLPPFGIWYRTNLLDTSYDLRDTYPRTAGATPETPVTNVWWETAPAYPIFYRVVATNAPSAP